MTDFQSLLSGLGKASLKTKLTVALTALAVAGVLAVAGTVASRPHFVTLYSELDDHGRVAVEKALAGAGVRFRASQPPAPYIIYVDESSIDQAQMAVAMAEALKTAPTGISTTESGAAAIFMSSGERQQRMLKRDWQETEHLLEQLDFVDQATVNSSSPDSSPLRKKKPVTVSVTLKLRNATVLSTSGAETVAKLVRYRFGVPAENVIISDHQGNILYDPAGPDSNTSTSPLEHAANYDTTLAKKVNDSLDVAFGKRKAMVTITSDWDYDQSTIIAETVDPETIPLSTETRTTSTPQGSASPSVGGPAGTASNIPDGFGVDHAAVPETGSADSDEIAVAETSDAKTVFDASRSKTQTVRTAPRLARLSVSLIIDESLDAKREEITEMVRAAVGFDPERSDVLGVSSTTFAVEEVAEGEGAVEESAPPNATMELLLTRGVEIVAALGFVALLIVSLKGGKKKSATLTIAEKGAAVRVGGAEPDEPELDPALVAQAQIEELVKTDPRRVSEILSRWASESSTVGAK